MIKLGQWVEVILYGGVMPNTRIAQVLGFSRKAKNVRVRYYSESNNKWLRGSFPLTRVILPKEEVKH